MVTAHCRTAQTEHHAMRSLFELRRASHKDICAGGASPILKSRWTFVHLITRHREFGQAAVRKPVPASPKKDPVKNKILTSILIFLLTSCVNEKSRQKFKDSHKICGELTIEQYNVFGQGAFGADLFGEWLTDSVSFRIFIGTSDFQ